MPTEICESVAFCACERRLHMSQINEFCTYVFASHIATPIRPIPAPINSHWNITHLWLFNEIEQYVEGQGVY